MESQHTNYFEIFQHFFDKCFLKLLLEFRILWFNLPVMDTDPFLMGSMFGSAASASGKGETRFGVQKNLLDFMVDDLKKVNRAVPAAEKNKLDAYLNAFEELQVRHSRLTGMKGNIKNRGRKSVKAFQIDGNNVTL